MKITRTPTGWTVDVPDDVAAALGVKDGDEVELTRRAPPKMALTPEEREEAIGRMRSLRITLPADYRFDREEANARR